ncbi:7 transmembrane receptor (rhodopsin family) domain-containing protein [Ditylenchus destructor]|uniref:7 transmembrane receptor (Rhodopsin family) domain-containing protein n=1 Tax=Ditylenchus destructor TaxID=166010 RepID=A0AAD4N2P9_9BILA|nr:7 transmembrane receptor (rhodopsin family) domain-containing protein [Ditylenchus destructor]
MVETSTLFTNLIFASTSAAPNFGLTNVGQQDLPADPFELDGSGELVKPEMLISDWIEMALLGLLLQEVTRTSFLWLKIHLTVIDLIVIACYCPSHIAWLISYTWKGGEFLCKAMQYSWDFCFHLMSFGVVGIAIDRLRTRLIVSCYIGAAVFSVPQWFVWTTIDMRTWSQCTTIWHKLRAIQYMEGHEFTESFEGERLYTAVHLMTVFWLPFLILFLAYFYIVVYLFWYSIRPQYSDPAAQKPSVLSERNGSDESAETVRLWQNGGQAASTPTLPIHNGSIKSGAPLAPTVPAWRAEMRSRMFCTTVHVIAAYLICWMPYNVLSLATFFSSELQIMISTHLGTLRVCVLLNTLLNPFIYGFRKAILKLPVPDLAPFEEEDKRNDPLGGLDKTRNEYLRAMFSLAFYDENCEKAKSVVRQTAYNGQMKSWAVKRTGILQDIGRLQSTLESNPFGSTVLADNLDEDILANVFSWKGRDKFVFMPAFDPTSDGNIRLKTGKYNRRPRTSFVQRDGMLKILTTEVSAYGLYWCFDQQKRDEPIKFVYYLIPLLPLYEMQRLGLHRTECSPGRGGETDRFAMLDANHRFRFLPQTLWGSDNDFCLSSWGECSKQLNSSSNELIRLKASEDVAYRRTGYDINLKIFVHWSPWSKCNKVDGVRTRSGQCHLGRIDHEVRFDPAFKERLFMSSRDYEWFMPVHSLIDSVQEFRDNGIPLFSGVLWDLLAEGRQPVSQCSIFSFNSRITSKIISDNYKSLWRMVIRPLMDKADSKWHYMGGERFQIGANPCFYWNKTSGSSASATGVLYAYTLIQNQKCS